jgi:hypothetical protein
LKLKTFPRPIEEFFFNLMRKTFRERSKEGAPKRRDFVDLLLQLREKGRVELDSRDNLDQELKLIEAWNQSNEEIGIHHQSSSFNPLFLFQPSIIRYN